MGYYIRVLSPSDLRIPFADLRDALEAEHPSATLSLEGGTDQRWDQLLLCHRGGPEIAVLERNPVADELGAEEIEEFREELSSCEPRSAADWLDGYLPRVRTIYAFQLLSGTDHENGWDVLGKLKAILWNRVGGIIQADAEGFTNEDGYHILWQFSSSVTGTWWMGVLEEGSWIHFEMDLGNRQHREAFLRGEMPAGVRQA
jgi:hypothetical protein